MKILDKIIPTLLLSTLIGSILVSMSPDSAKADVVKQEECLPAVLMLRGSGESRVGDQDNRYPHDPQKILDYKTYTKGGKEYVRTNGYEGRKLSQLLKVFVEQTDPRKTTEKVRFIGVDYPSLEVPFMAGAETQLENLSQSFHAVSDYIESYNQGSQNIVEFIRNDELRGCNTQYMLVGYSQGVISARLASSLMDNNLDKIISSYVIGDPFQRSMKASSERQKSPANTAYNYNGIGTEAFDLSPLNPITKALNSADKLIYRDDESKNIYSRSLCHLEDIVCSGRSAANSNDKIANHINYFDKKFNESLSDGPGDVDLKYEIEAFDQQVQTLANSTSYNPRNRILKKTPSFREFTTVYNVANARSDDRCSWDENSDGSFEEENILCRTYEYTPQDDEAKMTVKVVDEFGDERIYRSTEQVIQTPEIKEMFKLKDDQWYQFKLYETPLSEKDKSYGWYEDENGNYIEDPNWEEPNVPDNDCLIWSQDPYSLIDSMSWSNSIEIDRCDSYTEENDAWLGLKTFKPKSLQNSNNSTISSGYDSDYILNHNYYDERPALYPNSDNPYEVEFNSNINGVPYYNIKYGNLCASSETDYFDGYSREITARTCNSNNTRQMFSAIPVYQNLGSLSVEKDITPPEHPKNFMLQSHIDGKFSFRWDSVDDRNLTTDYELSIYDESTGNYEIIDNNVRDNRSVPIDLSTMSEDESKSYSVRSYDSAGNYSPSTSITFTKPSPIGKPSKPEVIEVSEYGGQVTLKLPEYDENKVMAVNLYDDGEYLGTFTEDIITVTAKDSRPRYTVRYKLQSNVFSIESDLTIAIVNNF